MSTLIEKALAQKKQGGHRGETFGDEGIELALAWVDGTINSMDVARAIESPHGNRTYAFLARTLAAHIRKTRT
jgi:hypothetical protein